MREKSPGVRPRPRENMMNASDAWLLYQQHHTAWLERTAKTWRDALAPHSSSSQGQPVLGSQFELLSDDVVENKIVAARMAITVAEQVSQQFDSLRQRTQVLEGQDMDSTDILRIETVCLKLVEQWVDAGLPRTDLLTVVDPLQRELAKQVQKHYQAVNVFYVEQGVAMPTDMRGRVRRTASGGVGGGAASSGAGMQGAPGARWGGPSSGRGEPLQQRPMMSPQQGQYMAPQPGMVGGGYGAVTGMTPLIRARQRAQGVMGQLRKLLTQPATGFDMVKAPPASAALAHALSAQRVQADTYYSGLAKAPADASNLQLLGVSVLCGIGFTMSLFIGGLAFSGLGAGFELQLKLGVLGGSVIAGLLGTLLLRIKHRSPS
eukprot:gene29156-36158_t